jgi:thiol-disulfide isomerase/thioredoxin
MARRPAVLLGLLLWAAAQAAAAALSHELTALPEPRPAPDFTLEDMDGEPHTLSALRGKVVVVNFWASWCGPCREELPSLDALYRAYKDRGLVVLGINEWESPDHVFSYLGSLPVEPSFPILFDRDTAVAERYGVKGLPTTFVVDRQGRLVYRAIGGRDFAHPKIRALVERLLGEAQGP